MEQTEFEAWLAQHRPDIVRHAMEDEGDSLTVTVAGSEVTIPLTSTYTENGDLAEALDKLPAPADGYTVHMAFLHEDNGDEADVWHFGLAAVKDVVEKPKGGGIVKLLDPKAADKLYKGGGLPAPAGGTIKPAAPLMTAGKPPVMEAEVQVTQTLDFPYKGTVYQAKVTASPSNGFSCEVTKDIYGTPHPSGSGLDKMILGAVILQYGITQGFDPSFKGIMAPMKEAEETAEAASHAHQSEQASEG